MKHISMDLSSNEECPIDIQISGGAWKINEICPHPYPRFSNFLFIVRFSWNLIFSIYRYSLAHTLWKNELTPLPHPEFKISYLWSDFHGINLNGGPLRSPSMRRRGCVVRPKAPIHTPSTGARLEWRFLFLKFRSYNKPLYIQCVYTKSMTFTII